MLNGQSTWFYYYCYYNTWLLINDTRNDIFDLSKIVFFLIDLYAFNVKFV